MGRTAFLIGVAMIAGAGDAAQAGPASSASEPGYVVGLTNPEDLVAIPGTRWIVASGLGDARQPGSLTLIDRESHDVVRLFPLDRSGGAIDEDYRGCPGPLDATKFSAHGLGLRAEGVGRYTLYVVGHGGREAIEVFALDTAGQAPSVRWIGCVPQPDGVVGNAVAALPGGGLVATQMVPRYFDRPEDTKVPQAWIAKYRVGAITGHAAKWLPRQGWSTIADTQGAGPNGIEVSPDGRWAWVANVPGAGDLARVPLDPAPGGSRKVVPLGMLPDNLRWGDDGGLWIVGADMLRPQYMDCFADPRCATTYRIERIDPDSMSIEVIPHPDTAGMFGAATTALKIDRTIWVGTHRGGRVLWFEK